MKLLTPKNGATVLLQTKKQREFYDSEETRSKIDGSLSFSWYDLVKVGEDESFPLPVDFVWENEDLQGETKANYCLLISENADMNSPWVYMTQENSFSVYNLKVGTTYFWQVYYNGKTSQIYSFKTALTLPRCLKIDDISNVRDMGGYKVKDGRIRQGLIFRGGEFDSHLQLAPLGAQELLRLKIKTDLDLRGESIGVVDKTITEILGINRIFVPTAPYTHVFEKEQKKAMHNFFKVFANAKNYPIYYHCWGGADRTGTLAFILGAYLGMDYEDLINEYEFTSLAIWGIRTRNYGGFQDFLNAFNALNGETLKQKAETFLKEYAGLTNEQLETIYDILVEKTTD